MEQPSGGAALRWSSPKTIPADPLYQRPYALTCHPERSEGSPRNGWGFFASLIGTCIFRQNDNESVHEAVGIICTPEDAGTNMNLQENRV